MIKKKNNQYNTMVNIFLGKLLKWYTIYRTQMATSMNFRLLYFTGNIVDAKFLPNWDVPPCDSTSSMNTLHK